MNFDDVQVDKIQFYWDASHKYINVRYEDRPFMLYSPPMVTNFPNVNGQGKKWDEMEKVWKDTDEAGGSYNLDLSSQPVDGVVNERGLDFQSMILTIDELLVDFVCANQGHMTISDKRLNKDQLSILLNPSLRTMRTHSTLLCKTRARDKAGNKRFIPLVDKTNNLDPSLVIQSGDLVSALLRIDNIYAIPKGKFGLRWGFMAVQKLDGGKGDSDFVPAFPVY